MRACAGQTTHLDYMLYVWQVDMFFVRIWKYFSIHNLYILRLAKTNISIFSRERFRSFVECLSSTHTCIVCGCWCWMKIVFFSLLARHSSSSSTALCVTFACQSFIVFVLGSHTHTYTHTQANCRAHEYIWNFLPKIQFHSTSRIAMICFRFSSFSINRYSYSIFFVFFVGGVAV